MRILIATSDSKYSEAAVKFGDQIAKAAGSEPTLLTIIKKKSREEKAHRHLAHAAELMGVKVHQQVRVGRAADEIIQEAAEGDYDIIIMGVSTTRKAAKIFLKTSTKQVIAYAPCPVLIAKDVTARFQHILICDSGADSVSLLKTFTTGLSDVLTEDTRITVLHVMSQLSAAPGVTGWQLRANAEELIEAESPEGVLLKQDVEILAQYGFSSRPKVRHGFVVDEINKEIQSSDYDLLAIGAHKSEGWQRILLDDLAEQIITQVKLPILIVR